MSNQDFVPDYEYVDDENEEEKNNAAKDNK
jgi:hypothetical protein